MMLRRSAPMALRMPISRVRSVPITKMSGTRRKPYAVRVPVRDRKGRVVQKYLSYHATQSEAWAALEQYRMQFAAQTAPAPETIGITLQDVYEAWSARKYSKAGKSSIASYKASWGRVRRLESVHIREIGIDQWQSILDDDEKAGASKSKINNDCILMRALSKFALERDWITKDYTQFLSIPSAAPKHEKGAFTELELKKIERLAEQGFPGADAALVLCYTGFRISEFFALTRFSYDRKAQTLTGGMKTAAGINRVVPIHPKIQKYVDGWAKENQDSLYTFQGKPISSQYYRDHIFKRIASEIGRPQATPHWCRHTLASRLHAAGADPLNVKRILGHADGNVTEHYTHVDLEGLRDAMLKIS